MARVVVVITRSIGKNFFSPSIIESSPAPDVRLEHKFLIFTFAILFIFDISAHASEQKNCLDAISAAFLFRIMRLKVSQ